MTSTIDQNAPEAEWTPIKLARAIQQRAELSIASEGPDSFTFGKWKKVAPSRREWVHVLGFSREEAEEVIRDNCVEQFIESAISEARKLLDGKR